MAEHPGAEHDPLGARGVALAVLRRVEADGAYADVALDAALRERALAPRDRAFAARLVYGTLAWRGLLDWHLARLAQRDPQRLALPVRTVLRLGLHQLLQLERVPAHAAVSTSVDLAKRVAPAAAGLVNAVLRRAVRERAALPVPDDADPVRRLALTLSHPEWLVARWCAELGEDETRLLLAADNTAAPTVLRARAGTRAALIESLARDGIEASPTRFAPDGVRVEGVAPHALAGWTQGAYAVQSEASQLVGHLLDARPGMRVLDACAAPGGKASLLAERVAPAGRVVAIDQRLRGARAVAATGRRLRVGNLAALVADARALPLAADARFDRVLVDAPCSGLGTLRAHPEVRWSRTADDVRRLAALQLDLLEAASAYVRPGGALVYATCTIGAAENEDVVDRWLAAHPELERTGAAAHLPEAATELVDARGALRTFPHRGGLDGFFAVRVRRRA
ncbi:MAG TPA: 16S rRNA (cytosine(967)-C(5))-methyltransferase RsmB [Candidatus Binatia bacterium]